MSTTWTIIVMGLIVNAMGLWASLWPDAEEEKNNAEAEENHRVA